MAFGQQAGPPATGRQIQELLQLLHDAGHLDFRDARGPMGFNQRQAGGRFTRDEAEAFIGRLQHEALPNEPPQSGPPGGEDQPTRPPAPARPASPRPGAPGRSLTAVPAGQLAAELRRRGWTVREP